MKHSRVCENFRLVDFSLLGTEPVTWKDQVLNDLRQFWDNDCMELVGAVNTQDSMAHQGKDFKLLFYKQPKYIRSVKGSRKCPFFVDPYYEDLSSKELQDILNQKLIDENATYRTALTVFEVPLGGSR